MTIFLVIVVLEWNKSLKIGFPLFLLSTAMTSHLFYTICLSYPHFDRRRKKFNIEKRLKDFSKVIVLRVVCYLEFLCGRIYVKIYMTYSPF